MNHSITTFDGIVVVSITGSVDSHAAGYLYDLLVECTRQGKRSLIVDLSDVQIMTRAGLRGLVVAAKLMQQARGEMRICGAPRSVRAQLLGLGYNHLLQCDATLQSSMARFCDAEDRVRDTDDRAAEAPKAIISFFVPASAGTPPPHSIGAEIAGEETLLRRREA